jgi:hypothetical protein
MNTPEPAIRPPEQCKHLRCKEMYYKKPGQEHDDFSGNAFWCSKTQEPFGPDGECCETEECCPGRKCYTS